MLQTKAFELMNYHECHSTNGDKQPSCRSRVPVVESTMLQFEEQFPSFRKE